MISASFSFRRIRPAKSPETSAFTLIELLVVVAILGIVAALAIPGFSRAQNSARQAESVNRLRALQTANIVHASENDGWYVSLWSWDETGGGREPWFLNEKFLSYLSAVRDSVAGGWNVPAQPFRSPMVKPYPGEGTLKYSFAMNLIDKNDYPNLDSFQWKAPNADLAFRTSMITSPGQHIAFADAQDFNVDVNGLSTYNGDEKSNTSTLAYRIKGGGKKLVRIGSKGKHYLDDRANVVFYDGHVEQITEEQAIDVKNRRWWRNQND